MALLASGCSTAEVTAPGQRVSIESLSLAVKTARAQPVARGIAAALRSPEIRATLLAAMQDSPWREHKLTLQEFARSTEGHKFMQLAADGVGMTESAFLTLVTQLPGMDLYLPFREHRLGWSGEAELLVGTTFDGNAPELVAYSSAGEARVLRLSDGMPGVPLLLLQPAERKQRVHAPSGGTPSVEHPGELAMLIEECDPETAIEPCDPGGGGGGGGGSPTPGVYVTHFHGFDDDGWFGDLEMLFRSRAWVGDVPFYHGDSRRWNIPQWCELGQAVLTWPPHLNWNGTKLISPGVTAGNIASQSCGTGISPHGYYIDMYEEDGEIEWDAHHWGHRFFSAHPTNQFMGAPWGASVGVNEAYYAESGSPSRRCRCRPGMKESSCCRSSPSPPRGKS
jgi:hypothetical protein